MIESTGKVINFCQKEVMHHYLSSKELEENKDMECCGNCIFYTPKTEYVGEGWCTIEGVSNLKEAKSYDLKCEYFKLKDLENKT